MREVASAIGDEGRVKHHEFVRRGKRGIYQGLTFWSLQRDVTRDGIRVGVGGQEDAAVVDLGGDTGLSWGFAG